MRIIHKGCATRDAADSLATIYQGRIDPGVTIHEVEVVSCANVT